MSERREAQKKAAGEAAASLVKAGMAVGLGTGSTARHVVEALGRRHAAGELAGFVGVPTSEATARLAAALGLPLTDLEARPRLDLAIDGADEIGPGLGLTKGGGGALVREKIVAAAATSLVVVADEGKLVERLGTRLPLPVAVVPFGWTSLRAPIEALGATPTLRSDGAGAPFVTDDGLFVLDCAFPEGIGEPDALDAALRALPGVVTSGLFLRLAHRAFVAGEQGVEEIEAP